MSASKVGEKDEGKINVGVIGIMRIGFEYINKSRGF